MFDLTQRTSTVIIGLLDFDLEAEGCMTIESMFVGSMSASEVVIYAPDNNNAEPIVIRDPNRIAAAQLRASQELLRTPVANSDVAHNSLLVKWLLADDS